MINFASKEEQLDFSDVLIAQNISDINSRKDVILEKEYSYKDYNNVTHKFKGIPIMSANMGPCGGISFARELIKHKYFCALEKHIKEDNILNFFSELTTKAKDDGLDEAAYRSLIFLTIGIRESLDVLINVNNKIVFDDQFKNNNKGDLLGSIGFTDDDVLNQSNRLAKTFIRLSFYDTPNRATQTLFYYSTIFINTSKQYAKYMRNISSKVDNNISYVDIPNDDDELALCCNFECFNKYNMSGSSEGFYLYMFPNIVNGLEETTMYMKVELNHSLYGKTIPLISPIDENGKFVLPQLHYEYTDLTSGRYTNLNKLYKDMYIEVKLKYDKENNRYIWYIPGTDNGEININLYEPRIINTDTIK